MTKRTRYGLLIAGFIIFIVGAPSLVLYVQGKRPGLGEDRTKVTGLISVVTEPSGAKVFLDNEEKVETPGAIRFLSAGDYEVRITKEGFYPWVKRLPVIHTRVTHANPNPAPLLLVKQSTPDLLSANGELHTRVGKRIVYSPETKKVEVLENGGKNVRTVSLPGQATRISADSNNVHALIVGEAFTTLLNTDTLSQTNYSTVFKNVRDITTHDGKLWGINSQGQLVRAKANSSAPQVMADKVLAYTLRGNEIYYITNSVTGASLLHAAVGDESLLQSQTLLGQLPLGNTYAVYSDAAKALFVVVDGVLMRVNETATPIAHGVITTTVKSGSLAYTTPGELWWYDSSSNKPKLVSRSSENFTDFYIDPSLQYAFFAQGTQIVALELDDRSGQNRYTLGSTTKAITTIELFSEEQLFYSSGSESFLLTIF